MKPNVRKKPILAVTLEPEVLEEFEKIAKAEHMEPQRFAALVLSKFSDLKQGNGLDAVAKIPKDLFKLRPGRVATASSAPDVRAVGLATEHAV